MYGKYWQTICIVQMLRMRCSWTFQHNNDPKHKALLTLQWLQQKNVKVLEWLSQSPDLNTINLLWGDLKHAVHASRPKILHDLEVFCQDDWAAKPPARIWCLIENYYKRLHAVIDAKGGKTQY
uniref:Tc1-like transposase DDE domain-containing protein n=1 Tax=Esox lucius TaxID=8010 RepID=A0AAY5JYK2_ESOLU